MKYTNHIDGSVNELLAAGQNVTELEKHRAQTK